MAMSNIPNNTLPKGGDARNGFLPLSKDASTVRGSNIGPGGDRRGGTMPLGGIDSPIQRGLTSADVGTSSKPNSPVATQPGMPLIPNSPFRDTGAINGAFGVPDDAMKLGGR